MRQVAELRREVERRAPSSRPSSPSPTPTPPTPTPPTSTPPAPTPPAPAPSTGPAEPSVGWSTGESAQRSYCTYIASARYGQKEWRSGWTGCPGYRVVVR
ncbi:hypothetical protein B9W61_07815 [Streptomyces sp. CS057]|nr:hypothetical protein B9W61_07815 [Streptomyces sp. CS057]